MTATASAQQTAHFKWEPANVAPRSFPALSLRTYIEQRTVREILEPLGRLQSAAEVGAGFGRMTIQLRDHAERVTAFEREPGMVTVAQRLLHDVDVHNVTTLESLPAEDGAFDLVLSFTVLQHMAHDVVAKVTGEIKRLSSRYVLIVEDTDPDHVMVDGKDRTHFTLGRSIECYSELMAPFQLIKVVPREVEAGFSYQGKARPFVGDYMLFERRAV